MRLNLLNKPRNAFALAVVLCIDTAHADSYIFRMHAYSSDLIRSLGLSEHQFLQVLLDEWELEGNGRGTTLKVRFGEDTPAISTRQAKYHLLDVMGDYYGEKRLEYQAKIDSFMSATGKRTFSYDDAMFPFRYVSGGTLPVVSTGGRSYYCLFYRDIFPIGWNIANGGCDTRGELHNPFRTIERELCEELLVVNPVQRVRYIFERNKNKLIDGLEFEVADNAWEKQLLTLDIGNFAELMLPIKWIEGPDSVVARYEDSAELVTRGYFLNINAEDFGIEVDKISRISLDESDVLMSGEIIGGHLVNEPIGLFDMGRFSPDLPVSGTDIIPDIFFFNAVRYEGGDFRKIVTDNFFPYVSRYRTAEEHELWEKTNARYDLCPVTRQIIRKSLGFAKGAGIARDCACDVFVSFADEDRKAALRVYDRLADKNTRVFMRAADASHEEWGCVDRALGNASVLVAVGSSRRALMHHFPSYEYRSFHRDAMFGKKGTGCSLVSFITDMRKQELPPPLCHFKAIDFDTENMDEALFRLENAVNLRNT